MLELRRLCISYARLVRLHDSHRPHVTSFFADFDYDVTKNVSLGANAKYFMTDPTLFGADVGFRNVAGMAVLGYKF